MVNEATPDNRTKILDVAMELAQTRGFNAFSYRDLASAVGIKTSSIHYYFPAKEDLGRALLQHYTAMLEQAFTDIRRGHPSALEQFRAFVAIFDATAKTGTRLCLGGMLASDLVTLPHALRDDVRQFFTSAEAWVAQLLVDGRARGEFTFADSPESLAAVIVAALEGALITGRVFDDQDRPTKIGAWLEALFITR